MEVAAVTQRAWTQAVVMERDWIWNIYHRADELDVGYVRKRTMTPEFLAWGPESTVPQEGREEKGYGTEERIRGSL